MSQTPSQIPPDTTETVHAESVLVLAPHPDDEVLGCGGLLAQLAGAGAAVRVLFLTDGSGAGEAVDDRAAYAELRRREAAAVADLLGFAGVEHSAVADGTLGEHLDEAVVALRRALLSQRPDLLLVPSPLEASRDHRAAFAAAHRLLTSVRPAPAAGEGDPLARISHQASSREGEGACGCKAQGESTPQAYCKYVEDGDRPATQQPHADSHSQQMAGEKCGLAEAVSGLRILAYEINRPAYPDLLVDVSGEVDRLGEAMDLYASQAERRGYWRASRGLRAYRTLTLGTEAAGPVAAEGYRRLQLEDFTTRSLAQLVTWMGGSPRLHAVEEGPLFSVVVRTKDRPELLAEALASLAGSTWRRAEVVLVNDGGEPPEVPADFPLPVVRVDLLDNRGRAAAANAGVEAAGGDYVTFLDDDDLVAPEHLETLAGLVAAAGVGVAYTDAAVGVYALPDGPGSRDGEGGWRCVERRLPYSRDFDPDLLLVDNYIPFNTLAIERSLFARVTPPAGGEGAADGGPFDTSLPFFEDWEFLIRLAAVTRFHHLPRVTCEYRHFRGGGHHVLGGSPRTRSDFLEMKARVVGRYLAAAGGPLDAARLARVVDALRAEEVEAREAASAARRDAETAWRDLAAARRDVGELARDKALLEDRWHRARGEVEALRGEQGRLEADLRRLYSGEEELRAKLSEQDAHLGRTYAEIQRLEGLIAEMRSTRAWRLHSRLQRLKGGAPEGSGDPGNAGADDGGSGQP